MVGPGELAAVITALPAVSDDELFVGEPTVLWLAPGDQPLPLTPKSKLRITCADGAEMDVMWVDENARPLRGRPMIGNFGVRLAAGGIKDILQPDLIRNAH